MGKGIVGGISNNMKKLGTSIGEGYAKQGLSWDEVSRMPSSGDGIGRKSILAGVKTGYDKYMSNNPQKQTPQASTSNMIQNLGDSSGLAASVVDTTPQPTLTSGIQNPVANSAMFNNRTNGSGMMEGLAGSGLRNRIQNNQGMQNQYGIIGGAALI